MIYIPKKPETQSNKMPSVPTSPLIMPCPTPIHSPAPVTNQRQMSAKETTRFSFECPQVEKSEVKPKEVDKVSTTLRMNGSGMRTKVSTIVTPPTPAPFKAAPYISPQPSRHLTPKITRQTIKDLPPIPKFKKLSSFPIVRRISSSNSNVVVPKLMSLELFNPETDDLDSDLDSSEPSSPDSIDSVINALQPSSNSPTEPLLSNDSSVTKAESSVAPLVEAAAVVATKLEDTVELVIREQEARSFDNADSMIINQNDINLNVKLSNHLTNINNNLKTLVGDEKSESFENCRENLVDFAEKLSAQLLKELDENEEEDFECKVNENNLHEEVDIFGVQHPDDPYLRKINGDIRNLSMLRDELRERRLQLANLSSKQHSQEIESYSNTPPTTIQELEEDDSPPLSAKIQSHLSQNPNLISNLGTPQATKKQQQKINDFIPEENEENDEDESSKADEDSSLRSRISFSHLSYNATNNNFSNTNDTALLLAQEDSFDEVDNSSSIGLQQMKQNLLKNIKHPSKLSDSNNNSNTNSCDSWANSNSTNASLDSPSVGGGSATHHRYYHVFREGELDALINKHVGNLHIVSSYYERASWCVVCEKVQMWTI